VTTQKERDAAKRAEKLEEVRRQVKNGSLTIRKMTAKEREAHPPKEHDGQRPKRARR
jgi:hypothetical protein